MNFFFYLLLITIPLLANEHSLDQEYKIKQAMVKIYTVAKVPNYVEPWSSSIESSSGSGAIIEGNRILTNAHVVANNTFMEVQKYGDQRRYIAKVINVSHQADIALLTVEDTHFFDGITPLELGKLPYVEQKVVVYGYPMGGNTLSVTTGIVSRVEHNTYAHSGEALLAIQIDAAVNPGNSGGPALSNGKIVGIVMQGMNDSQNIGYLVPTELIIHFLDDIKDGKNDGFADLGIMTQRMENPTIKKYYNLDENSSGIVVANLTYNSSLNGVLKKGDIIVAIDGHQINSDSTVEFRPHEFTTYQYFSDKHQLGENIVLDIIRENKPLKITAKLNHVADDILLVKTNEYDKVPRYFILGGYIFTPLSRNLLYKSNQNKLALQYYATQWPTKKRREVVVLLQVLASNISRGNYEFSFWPIEKLNGVPIEDFDDFYQKIQTFQGKYIILEDSYGAKIFIDKKEALEHQKSILQKYNIEFDRSSDLRGRTK